MRRRRRRRKITMRLMRKRAVKAAAVTEVVGAGAWVLIMCASIVVTESRGATVSAAAVASTISVEHIVMALKSV